ncbi:hypothetical protein BGZ65_000459, partial [Modicella reniformis]
MKKLFGGQKSTKDKDKKPNGSPTAPTHQQTPSRPSNGHTSSSSTSAPPQPAPTAMVFQSLAQTPSSAPPPPSTHHQNGANGAYGGGGYPQASVGGGYPA